MRYMVVWARRTGDDGDKEAIEWVEEHVNNNLANGWELLGGISITRSGTESYTHFIATQAMIKRD